MTEPLNDKPQNTARRLFLGRAALVVAGGAVTALAVSSAASAKAAQTAAHYQPTPKGKASCATCSQFVAPKSCKVVDGNVTPSGWCLLYTPKS